MSDLMLISIVVALGVLSLFILFVTLIFPFITIAHCIGRNDRSSLCRTVWLVLIFITGPIAAVCYGFFVKVVWVRALSWLTIILVIGMSVAPFFLFEKIRNEIERHVLQRVVHLSSIALDRDLSAEEVERLKVYFEKLANDIKKKVHNPFELGFFYKTIGHIDLALEDRSLKKEEVETLMVHMRTRKGFSLTDIMGKFGALKTRIVSAWDNTV